MAGIRVLLSTAFARGKPLHNDDIYSSQCHTPHMLTIAEHQERHVNSLLNFPTVGSTIDAFTVLSLKQVSDALLCSVRMWASLRGSLQISALFCFVLRQGLELYPGWLGICYTAHVELELMAILLSQLPSFHYNLMGSWVIC